MSNKRKPKVVDLEMGEDGSYTPKEKKVKRDPLAMTVKQKQADEKPKFIRETNADNFLNGVDVGLDFIDNVVPRLERFMRLRGSLC